MKTFFEFALIFAGAFWFGWYVGRNQMKDSLQKLAQDLREHKEKLASALNRQK